jgi:hypothetical protein
VLPNLCSDRALATGPSSDAVLHFLVKNVRRQDLKVVLKNKADKLVQADFLVVKDSYMLEHFDVLFNPSVVVYQAGMQATLGMIIRSSSSQTPPPAPDNIMRCLLVARIKNSSAKFTFKCEFRFMPEGSCCSSGD